MTRITSFIAGLVALSGCALAQDYPVEVDDLTALVLHEARGETFSGMVAVATVVLDRVEDPRWPATIEGVIYQPRQFSGMTRDKRFVSYDVKVVERASKAVWFAFIGFVPEECGERPILWFHTVDKPRGVEQWPPEWVGRLSLDVACIVGNHVFYRDPTHA